MSRLACATPAQRAPTRPHSRAICSLQTAHDLHTPGLALPAQRGPCASRAPPLCCPTNPHSQGPACPPPHPPPPPTHTQRTPPYTNPPPPHTRTHTHPSPRARAQRTGSVPSGTVVALDSNRLPAAVYALDFCSGLLWSALVCSGLLWSALSALSAMSRLSAEVPAHRVWCIGLYV